MRRDRPGRSRAGDGGVTTCDARFAPALAAEVVHLAEATPGTALERDDLERDRRGRRVGAFGLLVAVAITHGALTIGLSTAWATAFSATAFVGICIWHARRSRRTVLPGATAALRCDRRRALPPPD